MLSRYLADLIRSDLDHKMVFLSGPRQVGKTTLARDLGRKFFPGREAYLNWDARADRQMLLKGVLPADRNYIIFDEIHKYRLWKNFLKGIFDKRPEGFRMLVTGSARLDVYRRGGDSMLGRYHSWRLHPLSLAELQGRRFSGAPFDTFVFDHPDAERFSRLFQFGGFPELYLGGDARALRRWHRDRAARLVREDIRDLVGIRDLASLELMVELLPGKVGSLFSANALREDLQVSHPTLTAWLEVLERFYYHFRIYPYQHRRIRSLRKEPKLYLWDWSEVTDEDARLENVVASHLLKFCHFLEDSGGYRAQVYYLRDRDQREVDFLVCVGQKPWFAVEVKRTFREIPSAVKFFSTRMQVPLGFLVVRESGLDLVKDGVRVISADRFLGGLV